MRLYHYTCRDRAALIVVDGYTLRPGPDGVLWLTDLDHPFREALGLTSHTLTCDRTERRFVVEVPDEQFAEGRVARYVDLKRERHPLTLRGLDLADGAMPMHWWVSLDPQPCGVHE